MPKIMIVEDEEDIVTLLRYNLESAGFDVVSETNGGRAIDVIAAQKPDLLLLDWMLPEKAESTSAATSATATICATFRLSC